MGRRSRKRMDAAGAAAATRAERDAARRQRVEARASGQAPPALGRGARSERPPAPWGAFPLTELAVLSALVLGIAGLVVWEETGQIMLLAAVAVGSLAGVELSIREHFAGYRSHSTLLAAAAAFVAVTLLLLVAEAVAGGVELGGVALFAALVFAGAFYGLRQLFKSRSGGLGFR